MLELGRVADVPAIKACLVGLDVLPGLPVSQLDGFLLGFHVLFTEVAKFALQVLNCLVVDIQ